MIGQTDRTLNLPRNGIYNIIALTSSIASIQTKQNFAYIQNRKSPLSQINHMLDLNSFILILPSFAGKGLKNFCRNST